MTTAALADAPTILLADDDEDDRLLIRRSLAKAKVAVNLQTVNDGCDLLDYLHRRGAFADNRRWPQPCLVLLDLNMPRMDGREALAAIKSDARLRRIPVVVLTTSSDEQDIARSYDLHANSYVQKPVTAQRMVEVLTELQRYWLEIASRAPIAN